MNYELYYEICLKFFEPPWDLLEFGRIIVSMSSIEFDLLSN